jgi:hypothetical protein
VLPVLLFRMHALYDTFCICYEYHLCLTLRLFYTNHIMCILRDWCTLTVLCVNRVFCAFLKPLNYRHSCSTCVYSDRSVNIVREFIASGVRWAWHVVGM